MEETSVLDGRGIPGNSTDFSGTFKAMSDRPNPDTSAMALEALPLGLTSVCSLLRFMAKILHQRQISRYGV